MGTIQQFWLENAHDSQVVSKKMYLEQSLIVSEVFKLKIKSLHKVKVGV